MTAHVQSVVWGVKGLSLCNKNAHARAHSALTAPMGCLRLTSITALIVHVMSYAWGLIGTVFYRSVKVQRDLPIPAKAKEVIEVGFGYLV